MAHKVIRAFRDLTDNEKAYSVGDSYSHEDEERIAFLMEKGFLEKKDLKPKEEKPKADKPKKPKNKTDK